MAHTAGEWKKKIEMRFELRKTKKMEFTATNNSFLQLFHSTRYILCLLKISNIFSCFAARSEEVSASISLHPNIIMTIILISL